MKGFFVTGTDTGIGKTHATLCLMSGLRDLGFQVVGLKPVATGATRQDGRWVNEDALALQRAGSTVLPYELVNPCVFEPPASPHIAAALAGETIELSPLVQRCRDAAEFADITLVEGVGGWRVPLNDEETVADLARALSLPVILVVGIRLGCLNHALLTEQAIRFDGCEMAGWIANRIVEDFDHADANIRTLENAFAAPRLGTIPHYDRDFPGNGEFREMAEAAILRAWAPCDTFAP